MTINELRAKIFSATDRATELVDCPEWGIKILIQALSGTERDEYERVIFADPDDTKKEVDSFRARLVCMTALDPETKAKIFTSKDVEILGNKSAVVIDRLFQKAKELSGMFSKEQVKQEVKN